MLQIDTLTVSPFLKTMREAVMNVKCRTRCVCKSSRS